MNATLMAVVNSLQVFVDGASNLFVVLIAFALTVLVFYTSTSVTAAILQSITRFCATAFSMQMNKEGLKYLRKMNTISSWAM